MNNEIHGLDINFRFCSYKLNICSRFLENNESHITSMRELHNIKVFVYSINYVVFKNDPRHHDVIMFIIILVGTFCNY